MCYCCHDNANISIVEILLSSFSSSSYQLFCTFVDDLFIIVLYYYYGLPYVYSLMLSWCFMLCICTSSVGIVIIFILCIVWMWFTPLSQLIPCYIYCVLYTSISGVGDLYIPKFVTLCIWLTLLPYAFVLVLLVFRRVLSWFI